MTKQIESFLREIDIPELEFRIQKETFGNNEVIFTPQVRKKGKFQLLNFLTPWSQIVKIYEEYIIHHYPGQHNLTYEDCREHIEGFLIKYREQFLERTSKITNEVIIIK